jgi:hypothetical protein
LPFIGSWPGRKKALISTPSCPWLSAYLGHQNIIGTQVYLKATPQLLELASDRFEHHLRRSRGGRDDRLRSIIVYPRWVRRKYEAYCDRMVFVMVADVQAQGHDFSAFLPPKGDQSRGA